MERMAPPDHPMEKRERTEATAVAGMVPRRAATAGTGNWEAMAALAVTEGRATAAMAAMAATEVMAAE
jgi:hypothetical protein